MSTSVNRGVFNCYTNIQHIFQYVKYFFVAIVGIEPTRGSYPNQLMRLTSTIIAIWRKRRESNPQYYRITYFQDKLLVRSDHFQSDFTLQSLSRFD
jgi:hypothetical protein